MYTEHCTMYRVRCTLYSVLCTWYIFNYVIHGFTASPVPSITGFPLQHINQDISRHLIILFIAFQGALSGVKAYRLLYLTINIPVYLSIYPYSYLSLSLSLCRYLTVGVTKYRLAGEDFFFTSDLV